MTTLAPAAPVSLLARRSEATFPKFLFWSALVHVAIFSLALVYAKLHEEPAIDLDQKPIKATLVRQGTPRDEKLLPRIEQPPPPPVEQKAPEPVPVPEPPKTVAPAPVAAPAPPKTKQAGEKKADPRQTLMGAFDKMSKPKKINGHSVIAEAVQKSLNEYFHHLDGEAPDDIYRMVIDNVEKALLANIMERAEGNQTQAADMLGINRTTLRSKLKAHRLS